MSYAKINFALQSLDRRVADYRKETDNALKANRLSEAAAINAIADGIEMATHIMRQEMSTNKNGQRAKNRKISSQPKPAFRQINVEQAH